jgi:hypothetical protein
MLLWDHYTQHQVVILLLHATLPGAQAKLADITLSNRIPSMVSAVRLGWVVTSINNAFEHVCGFI